MIQTFCVPVRGEEDADAFHARLVRAEHQTPEQGWEAWTADMLELIKGCETAEARGRVQTTDRHRLRTLSLAELQLYESIGKSIADKRNSSPGHKRERHDAAAGAAPEEQPPARGREAVPGSLCLGARAWLLGACM